MKGCLFGMLAESQGRLTGWHSAAGASLRGKSVPR